MAFSLGQLVELQGLKNASHLNGKRGALLGYIEDERRWAVRLSGGGSAQTTANVKVKPENLKAYDGRLLFDLNVELQSRVASHLAPRDLLHLGLTCRRFGSPLARDGPGDTFLIEQIVKQMLAQEQSEDEKRALPRLKTQSYLAAYRELNDLRSPLQFDHLFSPDELTLTYINDNEKWLICATAEEDENDELPAAVSDFIMRAGKHYCIITVENNTQPCITAGITRSMATLNPDFVFEYGEFWRPVYNVPTYAQWDSDVHCCMYNAADGKSMWVGWSTEDDDPLDQRKEPEITEWNGMETLQPGSILGLLLDLDHGTLAVYKDGRRLGVMKDGLSGAFCWCVDSFHPCTIEIERGPVPRNL